MDLYSLVKFNLILVAGYFFLGATAIFVINVKKKESEEKNKERWVKYFFYLLIVSFSFSCIFFNLFFYFSILLSLFVIFEFIRISEKKDHVFYTSLSILIVLLYFFVAASKVPILVLVVIYTLVLTFDGFSQIMGQLFGRTKISPKISPYKTLEGFIGGYLFVLLTIYLQNNLYHEIGTIQFPFLSALLISGFCLIGDLLASAYKRYCNVKDYSGLIPGHGGVLDRFDSLIFVLASAQIYETLI